MVALRQVELSLHRGPDQAGGGGFCALAQAIDKTTIPYLRKYVVPAAKVWVWICWHLLLQKRQNFLAAEKI